MKSLIIADKLQLDKKFSSIFCDSEYIYLVNKNNKYLKVYNHNLEYIKVLDVLIDCDSICFDTTQEVFYVLNVGEETIISTFSREFKKIDVKILKLNNQPNKLSYCKRTKGLYLYTDNSIMEFSTDNLKLRKIINPYEEEYSPLVNNNYDFNLWEKQNGINLNIYENYKILDVASYDNSNIFMLNIVNNSYYIYKCLVGNEKQFEKDNEIFEEEVEAIDIDNKTELEPAYFLDDVIQKELDDIIQSPINIFDSYLRSKSYKNLSIFDEASKYDNDFEGYAFEKENCSKQKCKKYKIDEPCKDKYKYDCYCKNHPWYNKCEKCDQKKECKESKCKEKHNCCRDFDTEKYCCEVIHSVALVELSISHILNAEGEKIQKVVKCSDSICDILETNNSVLEVIEKVTRLEDILCCKLKTVKDICKQDKHFK